MKLRTSPKPPFKPLARSIAFSIARSIGFSLGVVIAASPLLHKVLAADAAWNVDADGNWVDDSNWNPAAAPGATAGATNTDTATFGSVISAARAITVDANRNILGIDFAGNSSGYTLGGGSLILSNNGLIQTSGGGSVHTDTINTPITLAGNATFATNSTTTGRILAFGSLATIAGSSTQNSTLTLSGSGTSASNAIGGIISNGTGFTTSIVKDGSGQWVLSGANNFSGGVTLNAGTLLVGNAAGAGTGTITLNGGTFGALGAQTVANTIVVTAATTTTLQGTGKLTLTGSLIGSGTLNIGSAGVGLANTAPNSSNQSFLKTFTGTMSVGGVLSFESPGSSNGADYLYNLSNAALTFTSGGSTQWNAANGSTTNNPGIAFINLGSISSASGVGTMNGPIGGGTNTKMLRYIVGTLNTDTTFGGVIAPSNLGTSFTKVGTGTLILTGTNTYAGMGAFGTFGATPATTIRGGTLQVGDGTSGSLASTGALTFLDTGKFNYQGQATGSGQSLGALTFSQGAGTVQSTYGTSGNTSLTFSNLAARTAGTTGNFVVSGGTNGTDNKIVFTLIAGVAPTTGALIDKGYYFGGSDFAAYDTGSYARALSYGTDTNTSAVDTIATGTHVKLTSTPAAQTGISLLTLNLAGSGVSWANDAAQTLTLSGGGLIKSGGGSAATISGGTGLTTGGATELVIRTDTASDSLDIQTVLTSGTTGGLTKTGLGTLTLSASGNAYTGATAVNEGTVVLSGTYSGSSAVTVNNSATLTVSGTLTSSGTVTVSNGSGNGVLNVNSGGTLALTGILQISNSGTGFDTGSGTVNVNSGGTISTNNDITVGLGGTQTGTMNIASGATVNIGTTTLRWFKLGQFDNANGVVNMNGGNLNLSFNSNIRFSVTNGTGTSVFNQNAGNVTVWSGNGTGTTGSVNDGHIDLQVGAGTANNTYNLNGGILTVNQVRSTSTAGTRTFNFNGGTLVARSASAATFFNLGTGNARANVRNGGAIIDTNGFSVTVAQALLHSNVSGDNAIDGGLTKQGTGTLTVTGASTYTGGTILNAGTLTVGTGGTLGATTGTLAVNNTNSTAAGTNVVLNLATATDTIAGSLSGSIATPTSGTNTATINNGGSGRNFTVNQTAAGTYAGVIAGAGSFTLGSLSTNTLTLTGTNTYTGATTVDAGTLLVGGSISGSTTTVNNTGTLGGAGGTTGAVVVNNGGTLSPGASIGTLNTTGDVTFNAGATFKLEIDTTTPATDLHAITGSFSLAGTNDVVLTITDLTPAVFTSGTLTFITYNTGTWNGGLFTYNSNVIADGNPLTVGANQFTLDYDFGGNSVALVAVPEPGSAVALFGGLGLLLGLQRFRRRRV